MPWRWRQQIYLILWQPLSQNFVITNTLTDIYVHSVSVILKLHGLTLVYFRLFSCGLSYIEKIYREKLVVVTRRIFELVQGIWYQQLHYQHLSENFVAVET